MGVADITLEEFARQGFSVLEPGRPYLNSWHIGAIAEHLTAVLRDQISKLLINIPIRCMKSLMVSALFPAWSWTFRPSLRFLTASYAQNLATRDARKSRLLIQSQWYQRRWGHAFRFSEDQNLKQRYENNRGGFRVATTPSGMGTGEGGDIRISDDPQNAKKIHSDAAREADIDWWKETWGGRVNDPKHPREVVTMQRLHDRDLSGHILAEHGDFVHLCLPMEYEPERKCVTVLGWKDPREAAGQLLWPERFARKDVEEMKQRLGSYGASGQLQQRPSPAGGGMVRDDWWRFYRSLPPTFDEVIQSWDMSFKKTTDGSFVVGQVWGRLGANKYLLDQFRRRIDFPQTLREVRALSAKWPEAWLKLVEDKANGPAVIDMLHGEIPGIVAVKADISKDARLAAVTPDIEAGNVYLPEGRQWVNDFVAEFSAFPNGTNDDQVDAATQALSRLYQGMFPGALISDTAPEVMAARREREADLAAVAAGDERVDVLPEGSWRDYDATPRRGR